MKKEKKQKNKMTTGKVYLKTLGLVTGRWIFSILGLIAGVLVLVVGIFLMVHVWKFTTDAVNQVAVYFVIVGIIAYLAISKIGKTVFRNAQITKVSYAFEHDDFPDKELSTSELLNRRFEVSTIFPMIIRTIDLLFIMLFRRKDKEFVANMKGEWRKSFADFVACFLTGIVPILGFCSLSWFLQNPEDGVLKGACDGLYGIYINKKKLIKRMIFVFVIELLIFVFLFFLIYIIIVLAVMNNEFLNAWAYNIGLKYESAESSALYVGAGIAAVLIVKFIPWLYIQSYGMISVLQIYTKATKENPPGTAPLYKKIIEKYDSIKTKWNEKKEIPENQ